MDRLLAPMIPNWTGTAYILRQMAGSGEYNPLDYENLTRNCVEELMRRGPDKLPPSADFAGAGVYALFYNGSLKIYSKVRSPDSTWPIYVGKAVPPGGRKGGGSSGADGSSKALFGRIAEHAKSIEAAESLKVGDFLCRYLVVTPLWITMAERFLIEHYKPVWNVCIEGFGNHDPGSGRHQGEITWWDALHPGRAWARNLRQTRTSADAETRLQEFLRKNSQKNLAEALARRSADSDLTSTIGDEDAGE